MKTPKIINAISFVEDDLISAANEQKAKKPFYIKPVFRRATAIAACLAIVAVTAFTLTKKPDNNITSNSSETSSQKKKVIYVTGDTPDDYDAGGEESKSLSEKYISPKLQEKIALYKDYKDDEVVFKVVVEIFDAFEDENEANRLANADKEAQLLFEQAEAAYLEEQKAWAEFRAFGEANPNNDPETIEKNKEFIAIIKEKEEKHDILWSKWSDLRSEIISKYFLEAKTERLKFATQYSEKEPVLVTDSYNDGWAYYMDLTAEEINILAEKGGYMFKLSSNDYIPGEANE